MYIENSNIYVPPQESQLGIQSYLPKIPLSDATITNIKMIAQKALLNLAVSLAANVAFITVFGIYAPEIVMLLSSVLAAAFVAIAIQKIWTRFISGTSSPTWEICGCKIARLNLVNLMTMKLNRFIHELGHAGAALATYVKAQPEIIATIRNGSTSYYISFGLTRFGKFLGEQNAALFVTAMGLASPVLCAMAEFAISYNIYHDHPFLGDILTMNGLCQLLEGLIYGMSAFLSSKNDLEHDFINLWMTGDIHPWMPMALIIALPLAEACLFMWLSHRSQAASTAQQQLPQ